MIYTFNSSTFGTCRLQRKTAGKQGFSAPKLFIVSTFDLPVSRQRSYRFVDKLIAGIDPVQLSDATLSRIAIAQFLACTDSFAHGTIEALDISLAPFTGIVLNEAGRPLRHAIIPGYYASELRQDPGRPGDHGGSATASHDM